MIKDHASLYFYKCVDILYVLNLLTQQRFIRSQSEFWYKIEDLLLRMRRDLSMEQIVELVEMYSKMGRGSQIFWGELEDHLMIHSSKLKALEPTFTARVILSMHRVGRSNETFWKIFTQVFESLSFPFE